MRLHLSLAVCALGCVRFSEDAPVSFADATVVVDAAAEVGETACDRAGGYAAIEGALRTLPDALAGDCRVGTRFVALAPDRRAHLAECMALQLGSILKCARNGVRIKYPTVDANGVLCRDMRGAHRGMGVTPGEVDAFVEHVLTLLMRTKIPTADLNAVRDVLKFQRGDIIERDAGVSDACPSDAAVDAGDSD